MFTFLAPAFLWLAPLLAVPLAIAFMGRAQPKARDFPSLLPVRESLQRAMKRHRLKNWLQLLLRTLSIACLVLAVAGPVWHGRAREGSREDEDRSSTMSSPVISGLVLHNGVYSRVPFTSSSSSVSANPTTNDGQTVGDLLGQLREGLDSLTTANQGRSVVEFAIPNTADETNRTVGPDAARFGDVTLATARLLQRLDEQDANAVRTGTGTHVYVPVFAARELPSLVHVLRPWFETHPNARLVLLDFGSAGAHLNAFENVVREMGREGDQRGARGERLTLRIGTAARFTPEWRHAPSEAGNGVGDMQAVPLETSGTGHALLSIPYQRPAPGAHEAAGTPTRWIAGRLTLAASDPARVDYVESQRAVSYRIPPPATLCYAGSREAFASQATLGEGGERLRIRSLSSVLRPVTGVSQPEDDAPCRLVYLADPDGLDAALLTRAATAVRSGGIAFLETGRHTDPALWNRNLLVPLGLGRLTGTVASPVASPDAARLRSSALDSLVHGSGRWGLPGFVSTRFGFKPESGTTILLTAAGRLHEPLLVTRRIGTGRIFLWTTSLSDPQWSDIGLGPWAALLHQALLRNLGVAEVEPFEVDSDSLAWWSSVENPNRGAPLVRDPDGLPFSRIHRQPSGWTIGPFDKTGVYRILAGADDDASGRPHGTSHAADGKDREFAAWLAVNLATTPPAPTASDWADFREAIGPDVWSRTVRLKGPRALESWRNLYAGTPLRTGMLILAALLLFAEGILSLRLSHLSNSRT